MARNTVGRWSAAIALAVLTTACGRQGERQASAPVEVDGRQVDLKQLQKESERAEKAAREGTRPLAPASLASLLPASVGGHARAGLKTETGPEPGMVRASARYVKGTAVFVLEVTDLGAIGVVDASPDAVGAQTTSRTATGYETITTAGGRMVTEQWDNSSKSGRYAVVAADRFSISAEGEAAGVEVLKAAVETVNAARLRALAPPTG
ncbi:hypothetical protein [Caulobacter sp. 1776]|uniref:hypothetical protein n=1 Tax=Caulobacter sp. 1776 TaxID=3156420 RepID=UPI003394068F